VRTLLENERSNIALKDYGFAYFPQGCCHSTSLALGVWLYNMSNKSMKIKCITGEQIDGKSHAWLEYNHLIIDITADQFEDITESVMITSLSSVLHASYKYERKTCIINENALIGQSEREVYKVIEKKLNKKYLET
ncbi:MAG: hypothetical protein ACI4C7_01245, partial [Clostridia bacterium]